MLFGSTLLSAIWKHRYAIGSEECKQIYIPLFPEGGRKMQVCPTLLRAIRKHGLHSCAIVSEEWKQIYNTANRAVSI